MGSASAPQPAFVCFTCGLEYPMASHRVLNAFKNSLEDSGPFFPFLEKVCPPAGASSMSPQGTVHVCSICYKSIHRQRHIYEISKTPEENRVYRIQNDSVINGTETPSRQSHWENKEMACYICNQVDARQNMDEINTCPPKNVNSASPRHRAFFPALQNLPKAIYALPMDEDGKIWTCKTCSTFLLSQWEAYELEGVPIEQRHYRVRLTESSTAVQRKASAEVPATLPPPPPPPIQHTDTVLRVQVSTPDVHLDFSSRPYPVHSPGTKSGSTLLTTVSNSSLSYQQQKCVSSTSTRVMDLSTTTSKRLTVRTNQYENQYYRPALHVSCICFVCGHHSDQGKTYSLRSKPAKGREDNNVINAAFFPFLATHAPPPNADKLTGEGVALVCIFCYHSLMAQWVAYDTSPNSSERNPWTRVYNQYNYVCYVCGVTTYRKRVRAVHITDYPFLVDHPRPAGSLVLNGGDRVVVCLMCYHTLNAQWNDFERMKVPVELRKYNWIAAPPPDQDPEQRRHSNTVIEVFFARSYF